MIYKPNELRVHEIEQLQHASGLEERLRVKAEELLARERAVAQREADVKKKADELAAVVNRVK